MTHAKPVRSLSCTLSAAAIATTVVLAIATLAAWGVTSLAVQDAHYSVAGRNLAIRHAT